MRVLSSIETLFLVPTIRKVLPGHIHLPGSCEVVFGLYSPYTKVGYAVWQTPYQAYNSTRRKRHSATRMNRVLKTAVEINCEISIAGKGIPSTIEKAIPSMLVGRI
jgi:hypothetical protein